MKNGVPRRPLGSVKIVRKILFMLFRFESACRLQDPPNCIYKTGSQIPEVRSFYLIVSLFYYL